VCESSFAQNLEGFIGKSRQTKNLTRIEILKNVPNLQGFPNFEGFIGGKVAKPRI
jgi:hypothetical protein